MSGSHNARRIGGRTFSVVAMVAIALLVAFPFMWVISISLKPSTEVFGFPPNLLTDNPTAGNYLDLLDTSFPRSFFNSTVVAFFVMVGNVAFAVMAGYAFAKLRFPGRRMLFFAIISSAMIPLGVTLIPLFLMTRSIPLLGGNNLLGSGGTGLLNTYAGLVLPHFVGPLNVFLARQFFVDIPGEYAEAARLDGASEYRIFAQIYVPMARPAIATIAILSFTASWDDFLWPLVVTSTQDMQTVQLMLMQFTTGGFIQWGPLMAATVLITLPVVLFFVLNQRHFVQGLTAGGTKG